MSGMLDLAVVVPTFNEKANVAVLVAKLDQALAGLDWEAVFVDDDSPDGTASAVREIARVDRRIRVIQRIGRRGLSSACIEGMCATAAPLVAVIDGDMQHDETLLPAMAETLRDNDTLDLVVGSRFVDGGGTGEWDRDRVAKSAFATKLSQRMLKVDLTDPMSGFFMVRSDLVRNLAPNLAGIGFKILLDILTASPRRLNFAELPYTFRVRTEGESKLDHVVAMEYLIALYDRKFGKAVPVRFAMFSAIGAIGVGLHFAVLSLFYVELETSFLLGTILATVTAMTFNFFLNNTPHLPRSPLEGLAAIARRLGIVLRRLLGRGGRQRRRRGVPPRRPQRLLGGIGADRGADRRGVELRAVVAVYVGTVLDPAGVTTSSGETHPGQAAPAPTGSGRNTRTSRTSAARNPHPNI